METLPLSFQNEKKWPLSVPVWFVVTVVSAYALGASMVTASAAAQAALRSSLIRPRLRRFRLAGASGM
ncbi:hypothetical protein Cme02nite_08300 [Catellatospora methionotrophica]|uniref:Uncharacterized protein n=1 Tax=Catellatospora methionotrophica TaxID=121620 RepID=A0A8J3PDM8_9ACTN|nr:hypothetical protein Cme02nite_08300 [Catellatospora methionotrophica]